MAYATSEHQQHVVVVVEKVIVFQQLLKECTTKVNLFLNKNNFFTFLLYRQFV
jgi:hypothetical protein